MSEGSHWILWAAMSREHGAGKEQAPGGVFSPTGLSGEAGGQNTRGRRVPGEI